MNLEFQSASKSTISGIRGIDVKTESFAKDQTKWQERSSHFRDLLEHSKQSIGKADRHEEKLRESRQESGAVSESDCREKVQRLSKDIEEKADDGQVEEPVAEELKCDEDQVGSLIPAFDPAQLIGVQNLQGGLDTALTRLSLKLGLKENEVTEGLKNQGQVIELIEQPQNLSILTNGSELDGIREEELPALNQTIETDENGVDELPGLFKKYSDGLAAVKESDNTIDHSQQLNNQISTGDDPQSPIFGDDRKLSRIQSENIQTKEAANVIDGANLKDQHVSEKTMVFEVQTKTLTENENQNPNEIGVQEINLTGINANRGAEVQPNTKVEVAQQVEQKIIQNFEPNKPMVLQMTLSPDNLGDIDIKLSYDQGKLVIDITALSQDTQNLLGKQINQLVRGLALHNVQVETVHVNTPVEQSSDSQNAAFTMNGGSDPNQKQNQTLLREQFIKNSGVLNRILTGSDDDEAVLIPQNLQNYRNHRVNYLI